MLSNRTASESKNLGQDIFSMKPNQPKVAAALYQGANCALRENNWKVHQRLICHPTGQGRQGSSVPLRGNEAARSLLH